MSKYSNFIPFLIHSGTTIPSPISPVEGSSNPHICEDGMKLKLILFLCVASTASTAFAQTQYDPSALRSPFVTQAPMVEGSDGLDWHQVGIGFSTAIGNLFYIPAKVTYATLGGVAGGVAYVFTRRDHRAAHDIWHNSLGGDYVLTPAMIRGQDPIHFMDAGTDKNQLMTETRSAQKQRAFAKLPVSRKESARSTPPKTTVADSRHTLSDSEHQFSALNMSDDQPAKRDEQHGNPVEQSGLTSPSARPVSQERVPQFIIVPR